MNYTTPPPCRWTPFVADMACDDWKFNCGPASIAMLLGLKPNDVRPHMQDFERKGYTNPTLMAAALRSLRVRFTWASMNTRQTNADGALIPGTKPESWPDRGLVRVQWAGPWTRPGVPIQARYRKTHWVASWRCEGTLYVGDINATCCGGWLPFDEWSRQLVPWLLREVEPKASGCWWPTHFVPVDLGGSK